MLTVIRTPRTEPSETGGNFSGGPVWRDQLMAKSGGVTLGQVFFAPCARTHWHTHEGGQVLVMLAGEGFVADADGPVRVRAGEMVWTPAGVRHWHGAAEGNFLIHATISLGDVTWDEAVSDVDYRNANSAV